jgi:hypothetical protein
MSTNTARTTRHHTRRQNAVVKPTRRPGARWARRARANVRDRVSAGFRAFSHCTDVKSAFGRTRRFFHTRAVGWWTSATA